MRSRRTIIGIAIALFIITITLYWPTRHYDFVNYDDNDYVSDNAFVVTGLTPQNIRWAFTHFHAGYWIPLTWISHMIDCQFWGARPGPPHLVNVAFHSANAILVFLIFFLTTGAIWRSAFVAALFALHPLHVESVAWIAGRKDVLSTLLWLVAILAYWRFMRGRNARWYAATFVCFILGLMAKPTLVTLPVTLLLLDFWPLKASQSWTRLFLEKLPFFVASLAFSALTIFTQAGVGSVSSLSQIPISFRLVNALVNYGRYLTKTFWPVNLIAFYPLPNSPSIWLVLLVTAFLFAATVFALKRSKTEPHLLFGWLWFLVTLFPTIGLFQSGGQSIADRFTYVPLIGIFAAISWQTAIFAERSRIVEKIMVAVAIATIGASACLSAVQIKQWRDPITLFSRILKIAGPVPVAEDHLGSALYKRGEMDGAIRHFRSAIDLNPRYPDAHNNLGVLLSQRGSYGEAYEQFREAIRLNPQNARAYNNFGNALQQSGETEEAIRNYQRALKLQPGYWAAHNNLGAALCRAGRKAEAIEQFREALKFKPDFEPARRNIAECGR